MPGIRKLVMKVIRPARQVLFMVLIGIGFLLTTYHVQSQSSRSWDWVNWNVNINNISTADNKFHVQETQGIKVRQGLFIGGDRSINMDHLILIDNILVRDGTTDLQFAEANSAANCPTTPGIYCLFMTNNNELDIYYNFPRASNAGD